MAGTAAKTVTLPARRRNSRAAHGDKLVPWAEAARRLGRSADTLRLWHDAGYFPAVVTPGDQWSAYDSFIEAVLASARPGQAGQMKEIARAWFAARIPEAVAS
jgi:hypothetical protein